VSGGLHLIKLCVGEDNVDDLRVWQASRLACAEAEGRVPRLAHITRMTPRRAEELLDGGSLYWVMKGAIRCRQRLIGIEPFTDEEGVGRCRLVLDPAVVVTEPQPRRPFQGWRYFEAKDAPRDLASGEVAEDMPAALQEELDALGLR